MSKCFIAIKQTTKILCLIVAHDLTWNGLDMCSKLLSKCLPFRACLWAFLSAFYWRFCLVGLSVYSYPGLEAHVCDGLSGWKKYVTCVKTLLLNGIDSRLLTQQRQKKSSKQPTNQSINNFKQPQTNANTNNHAKQLTKHSSFSCRHLLLSRMNLLRESASHLLSAI